MYFYIVNPAAGGGKFTKHEAKLLSELKKHNILGDWSKTTGRPDVSTLVNDASKRGFQTIVAVGGDGTISEIVNDLPESGRVIGIIPTGATNLLADLFGISYRHAPAVLSQRRLEEIRLARTKDRLFIHRIEIPRIGELHLTIDDAYSISGVFKNAMITRIFGDDRFEIRLITEHGKLTLFKAGKIESHEAVEALVDNVEWKGPLAVSLDDKVVRIIVGKERMIKDRN